MGAQENLAITLRQFDERIEQRSLRLRVKIQLWLLKNVIPRIRRCSRPSLLFAGVFSTITISPCDDLDQGDGKSPLKSVPFTTNIGSNAIIYPDLRIRLRNVSTILRHLIREISVDPPE